MEWTFDIEQCGDSIYIDYNGMRAVFNDDNVDDESNVAIWEYNNKYSGSSQYQPFIQKEQDELETAFQSGKLFESTEYYSNSFEIYLSKTEIKSNEINEMK